VISQYVLNSLMTSVVSLRWYDYTVYQNYESIDAMINGFEDAFGRPENCTIVIKAA
jgi:hypothetical protein